jgi:hypothetical protein
VLRIVLYIVVMDCLMPERYRFISLKDLLRRARCTTASVLQRRPFPSQPTSTLRPVDGIGWTVNCKLHIQQELDPAPGYGIRLICIRQVDSLMRKVQPNSTLDSSTSIHRRTSPLNADRTYHRLLITRSSSKRQVLDGSASKTPKQDISTTSWVFRRIRDGLVGS